MADKVIKEHYVPQRYLRHFANGNKFYVYDKEKSQQRSGNVGDYACERFFYDIDFGKLREDIIEKDPEFEFDSETDEIIQSIDEQYIEHWFGENVEAWLFNPIDSIISSYAMCNPQKINSVSVLTEIEMDHLSMYIAIQVMRSKEFRECMTELYEQLPLLLMKKMAKTQEEKDVLKTIELKVKSENHKKLLHAQFFMDQENVVHIAESLREKCWIIAYNQNNMPLLTSDNPVVKFGHLGGQGFKSKGIEIFFPINPRLILILKDSETFWYEMAYHNHFVKASPDEVEFYNSLQVQQSYRYIFDKEGDFSLVDSMMKRNSEISNIKHKRFWMG